MPTARRHRSVQRLAAVGTVVLLAAALPGAGSSAREQQARLTVAYDCGPAAGDSPAQEVRAEISGTFPEAGLPERPIQPGELTVRVALSGEALAALFPDATGSIGGSAALTTTVAQRGGEAVADWAGLSAEPVELPQEGGLTLRHSGPVAPVTVDTGGDVTFTAGELALDLQSLPHSPAPGDGDGTGGGTDCGETGGGETGDETTGDGTAGGEEKGGRAGVQTGPSASARPSAARLECAPAPGEQGLLLATVPVSSAPGGSASPSPGPDGPEEDGTGPQ